MVVNIFCIINTQNKLNAIKQIILPKSSELAYDDALGAMELFDQ